MREIHFTTENLTPAKQVITAWAIMFVEVILFALISTLLSHFGTTKDRSILISLVIMSLLTVIAQMLLHGYVRLPASGKPSWSWPLVLPLPYIYKLAQSAVPIIACILNFILILLISSLGENVGDIPRLTIEP